MKDSHPSKPIERDGVIALLAVLGPLLLGVAIGLAYSWRWGAVTSCVLYVLVLIVLAVVVWRRG